MALPRCGQSKHFACPCARRVLRERPAQKDCRFLLRVRCPPTAFPAAPSPRTETSARPVSKSSSKQDYTIQRPSKRPHIGRGAAQTIRPKPVTPMSESGSSTDLTAPKSNFRSSPESGLKSDIGACPRRATSGLMHCNNSNLIRSPRLRAPASSAEYRHQSPSRF
jgi:hypothetical protein